MVKGTASFGKHSGKIIHIKCRRCGRRAYHITKKRCAACGYGKKAVIKRYAWQRKNINRVRLA